MSFHQDVESFYWFFITKSFTYWIVCINNIHSNRAKYMIDKIWWATTLLSKCLHSHLNWVCLVFFAYSVFMVLKLQIMIVMNEAEWSNILKSFNTDTSSVFISSTSFSDCKCKKGYQIMPAVLLHQYHRKSLYMQYNCNCRGCYASFADGKSLKEHETKCYKKELWNRILGSHQLIRKTPPNIMDKNAIIELAIKLNPNSIKKQISKNFRSYVGPEYYSVYTNTEDMYVIVFPIGCVFQTI